MKTCVKRLLKYVQGKNMHFYKKYNKYRNKSKDCFSGHKHQSIHEANYCNTLMFMLKGHQIKHYETQKSFDLHGITGKKLCIHKPDFYVITNEGKKEVHECKEKHTVTSIWRLKKKLFECDYPNIAYKVIWK